MMRNFGVLWLFSVFALVATPVFAATSAIAPDGLVARKQGGAWIYYAFDQQGNVAQRLNSSGTVLNSSTYDAYGNEALNGSTQNDPWAYNAQWGYVKDTDTGLYYCQNRWYDPTSGRWLTRDPIGYAGGATLYSYCGSQPIWRSDSNGLMDSVSAFCRRFPAFCVELAEELGWAGGAGGAAGGSAIGRELMDGDNDEQKLIEGATNFISECARTMGSSFYTRTGQAAHNVLNRAGAGNGFEAERRVGGFRLDLYNSASQRAVEWKPASMSGIQRGVEQAAKYERENPGMIVDVVPYPAPWAPHGWNWVPNFFN